MSQQSVTSGPSAAPLGDPEAPETRSMELWVSYTLRIGVSIAAIVILAGVILYVIQGSSGAGHLQSMDDLKPGRDNTIDVSWTSIRDGLKDFQAIAIIQVGLLILLLTPVTRVALTLLLFLRDRDRIFAVITAVVLTILLLGFFGIV
ncbi:MAG TPA: DUF1634 domain-containing protein [Thermomicrobiales bacterium]|nr:DUF1634 domain-containing protein [Thermomicrobiales bacterium]